MIKNLFGEFFADLYRQKLRSSLTLTAIAWGTLVGDYFTGVWAWFGNQHARWYAWVPVTR